MRVFVYEFITGGGLLGASGPALGGLAPSGSLLAEGAAMHAALCEDFAAAGCEVLTLRDFRLASSHAASYETEVVDRADSERQAFERFARTADWTLVVAPELDGALDERCQRVIDLGGRLLGPGPTVVRLSSDKTRLCEQLSAAGIPTPRGELLAEKSAWPVRFKVPCMLKPNDGAGSYEVRMLFEPRLPDHTRPGAYRLEEYCRGRPLSVAVLCGPRGPIALPACEQILGGEGGFNYLGGRVPVDASLALRARTLALRVANALPAACGYVGVDLVLGMSDDGDDDYVIEVNPRCTTSYVGLRRMVKTNLARAMIEQAEGRSTNVELADVAVEFTAAGEVTVLTRMESAA